MSSVLEKELTCSICTDILFDPLTLLDCLHTNCGACAKSWFASQQTHAIASSSANVGKFTCPVCRAEVRATRLNPMLSSLLEDFVKMNPDKDRTAEEKREMRKLYTPGDDVLPGRVSSGGANRMSVDGMGVGTMISPPLPRRNGGGPAGEFSYADIFEEALRSSRPFLPQNQNPPRLGPVLAPLWNPSMPFVHSNTSVGSPMVPRRPAPPTAPPRTSAPGTIPVAAHEVICDYCIKRINTEIYMHCDTCNEGDFDMCMRCYRVNNGCQPSTSNSQIHHISARRFQPGPPAPHLEVGVFCAICAKWCDGDRKCYWKCGICEDFPGGQKWNYCESCVGKGACCGHDLELWNVSATRERDNRRSLQPPVIRVSPRTLNQEYSSSNSLDDLVNRLERLESSPGTSRPTHFRATNYIITCSNCRRNIPLNHSYLHCTECFNGAFNICLHCHSASATQPFPTPPSPGPFSFLAPNVSDEPYRCRSGHDLQLLTQFGNPGTRKIILDKVHWPPEFIDTRGTRGRNAVALRAHWPDERAQWGRGWSGLLAFPKGAGLSNVYIAFEEAGEFWCWGWFAGVGGVFKSAWVRFVD